MYFFAEILPLYFVLLLFWMSCPHGALARQGKQGSHIDYEAAAGPHISLCQVDIGHSYARHVSLAIICFPALFYSVNHYTFKFALFVLPCTRTGVYTFMRYEA